MLEASIGIPAEKVSENKRKLADRESFFAEANEHKSRAIDFRKEKRFWDALVEDAMYFHHMRLCEVFMRDDRVEELKQAFKSGVYTKQEYDEGVKKADEFLSTWSDESRAEFSMRTSMTRLKLVDDVKRSLATDVVKWSLENGSEEELKGIIRKYKEPS